MKSETWVYIYALKNCADEFQSEPFATYEAAVIASRRKKGQGNIRWSIVTSSEKAWGKHV